MRTFAIFHLYPLLTTNTIDIYKNQLILFLRQTFLLISTCLETKESFPSSQRFPVICTLKCLFLLVWRPMSRFLSIFGTCPSILQLHIPSVCMSKILYVDFVWSTLHFRSYMTSLIDWDDLICPIIYLILTKYRTSYLPTVPITKLIYFILFLLCTYAEQNFTTTYSLSVMYV